MRKRTLRRGALFSSLREKGLMVTATEEVAAVTRRHRVSSQLESELAAQGVAQAVVFLEPRQAEGSASFALSGPLLRGLESCFVKDERSISAALLSSSAPSLAAGLGGGRSAHSGQESPARARSYVDVPVMRTYAALRAVLGDVHTEGLEKLAQHPAVRYVASSLALRLIRPISSVVASRPTSSTTWGIEKLGIPQLWAAGLRGEGVKVGHLDTGVDKSHPALRAAVQGYLLTDHDGFEVIGASPHDTQGHGTHTAATIAGRAVSGRNVGVAPGAQLFCGTVIDGGNVVTRILNGLDWLIRQEVRIISLSLGLPGYREDFHVLLDTIREGGVLTVAAVGNEYPGTSRSPGNYNNVLSVGACDEEGGVADFSSSQWFQRPGNRLVPDLVAPGVDVVSAKAGGGLLEMTGTSMATAHIAGLAALLWGAKPSASLTEIEDALCNSCALGTMTHERANRGLPNGPRAYELLIGTPLPATGTGGVRPVRARSKPRAKVRVKAKRVVRRKRAVVRPRKK